MIPRAYTIEELIDVVNSSLTMSGALPQLLPTLEIQRLIEIEAMPWFYKHVYHAVQKMYYYVDHRALMTDEYVQQRSIKLPCDIQEIAWVYETRQTNLLSLGINSPNLSINMGVTNSPYVSSFVTTVGELGVYKTILDSFSDMLNQFSKYTVKHDYNQMNNRLNILGNVSSSLVLECFVNVQPEGLFSDPDFIKYCTALAKQQLGQMLTRYNFNLPGGIQFDASSLISEGQDIQQKVEEELKYKGNSSFFFMVKK